MNKVTQNVFFLLPTLQPPTHAHTNTKICMSSFFLMLFFSIIFLKANLPCILMQTCTSNYFSSRTQAHTQKSNVFSNADGAFKHYIIVAHSAPCQWTLTVIFRTVIIYNLVSVKVGFVVFIWPLPPGCWKGNILTHLSYCTLRKSVFISAVLDIW